MKLEEINQNIKENLKEKVGTLPLSPGVYQFKNEAGTVIYIGKAKKLRNRVRSYFQDGRPSDAKTKAMIDKISDLEVIVVDSEAEALILEDTLVKKHKPRYNILLRDDKSYPYIRVTNEPFPRIFVTRKIIKDGSKYFGPFTEVGNMRRLMKALRSIFMFRSCKFNITEESVKNKKFKICLDYHIKKCEGPCEGFKSKESYNENVRHAIQILNGKTTEIENHLKEEMLRLSEELRFEEAASVKSKFMLLKDYSATQKIVSSEIIDRDVLGMARLDKSACTLIFKVRDGKLIGRRHFIITDTKEQTDEEIIETTLEKWYSESEFVPKEIYLPCQPDQTDFFLDWLKQKRGKTVEILIPKIGERKKLVAMANANAEYQLRDYHLALAKREQTVPRILLSMQRDLKLPVPPKRIECFDNSHIQGSELVSSMVVFENGKAKKSDYRKYIIQTVHQNDDFAAMQEVVSRRYKRLLEENQTLPDLIIIDGGKGQLSHAVAVLGELGIQNKVSIVGLAKRLDEIFFPGKSESLILPRTSSSLRILQQARDEAHRFAITFHRKLREKRTLTTELTTIPGIGNKLAQKLLINLGSVENIKNTGKEELLKFVNERKTQSIIEHFSKIKETENQHIQF